MATPAPRIRPSQSSDFEQWADLYRGYRAFYRLEPSDAVVERVWSWIQDPSHEVNALVAELDGRIVGLAHHRRFARPSSGTVGLYLDDLFTAAEVRGQGVGRALLAELSRTAAESSLSVVRWITAQDNTTARRLYDSVAAETKWVTYDLTPERN